MANSDLNKIDEILAKPFSEWSEEENEIITNWKIENALREDEHQATVNAIQDDIKTDAQTWIDIYNEHITALDEMKKRALAFYDAQ